MEHRRLLDLSVKHVALVDARDLLELPTPRLQAPSPDAPPPPVIFEPVGAGIHEMSAERYHADPCPEPSLSSSIAKLLCNSSPAHARQKHPRLNPQATEEESGKFDIGKAAHALLLEGDDGVVVVDAPDWRTKLARQARDAAHAAGKTPLLAGVWADVQAMATAAREQLAAHVDGGAEMFTNGKPEQTLIWQEDCGTWCRARLDWMRPTAYPREPWAVDDYKSTSGSANPDAWSRTLFALGFDLQVAWYVRGVKVLTGADANFRFAVQETYPPYALSVVALGPDSMTLGEKKRRYALALWEECRRKGKWPAYPTRTCWADLPPWEEARWLSIEEGLSFDEAR